MFNIIFRSKLENFELQEAQKKSLENRLVILTEINDCLVVSCFSKTSGKIFFTQLSTET